MHLLCFLSWYIIYQTVQKSFYTIPFLDIKYPFQKYLIEFWINSRKFINPLSRLNYPVNTLDWSSNLYKSFLRIVTTDFFISSHSPIPLSISFVNDFFSDNGVVTTASFLSSKILLTFWTNYMMDFPFTLSCNLVDSRHRLST